MKYIKFAGNLIPTPKKIRFAISTDSSSSKVSVNMYDDGTFQMEEIYGTFAAADKRLDELLRLLNELA